MVGVVCVVRVWTSVLCTRRYHEGFSQRLISVQVPSFMDGVASRIAAEFIFKHCGAVLLAVHQRREDALLEPVRTHTPIVTQA